MGRVVSCRECDTEVELPDVLKPGKLYRCPDCREPLPLPTRAKSRPAEDEVPGRRPKRREEPPEDEDEPPRKKRSKSRDTEDEQDAPPRRKKRKTRPEPEAKPFWQSKQGKILSGVLLLGLGVVAVSLTVAFDARKPIRGYIGGGLCVLFGLGGIVTGFASSDDDGDGGDGD